MSNLPSTRPDGWNDPAAEPIAAPLRLHEATVGPQRVDYNGHMSEWCYLLVMGDSSDQFFRYIGIDDAYRASGKSLYTVETRLRNLAEVGQGARLGLALRVLGTDAQRVHLAHEVTDASTGALVATAEQLLLHVDSGAARVAPMPDTLHRRVQAVADAHAGLPVADWVGRPMGLRRTGG